MFVRVETGFKTEFVDPEARRIQQKVAEIHPQLAEKVRWVRKLKCYWLELDAPRDKVIQSIQQVFKIPVTHWLFSGDLLPSAAGTSGTLQDLMQAAPYRPGVFHGIEKRKRINIHDEEAIVLKDVFKTVLGDANAVRANITGELLLIEGAKLTQSDLEWIAKHWFAQDKSESWSLISEEELKRNARFQSDQVAKYLGMGGPQESRSRLLQFRQIGQSSEKDLNWSRIDELFRSSIPVYEKHSPQNEEEWVLQPEIRFASDSLISNTRLETEFHLVAQQLEALAEGFTANLQTVLGVLPNQKRIWFGENYGYHPIRVRDEFETALKSVAETTATPIVQMKLFEDSNESEPSYFWSSVLGVSAKNGILPPPPENVELIWVGDHEKPAYQDLTYVQNLKSALQYGRDARAVSFVLSCSGKSLLEVLKRAAPLQYGFDLILDAREAWFQKSLETPMALSQIWGISPEQKTWLFQELTCRNIPFFHLGSNNLSGDVKLMQNGAAKIQMTIKDFFKTALVEPEEVLLDQPIYSFSQKLERRIQPVKFKNRYSVEELLLKPETYHASIASPVVIRPDPGLWTGVMVLSDLCGEEFTTEHMEYLLRKCTALGGQMQSMQISMLNGLKSWYKVIKEVKNELGIQLTQLEILTKSQNGAHWLALQLVARMNDIRNIRSEDFKQVNDRIYWLPGGFDHPATRWLAGLEGRYQNSLHSAIAIEPSGFSADLDSKEGVTNTLTFALLKRKLGAELRLQHYFPGGFFVSIGENERYAVEEEWASMGIECEYVGKVTSTPHLVIRDEDDRVHTISIEDLV